MLHEVIDIQIDYQKLGIKHDDYQPKLYTYVLDNSIEMDINRVRPAVLICPGGGYSFTSDREAEAIAIQMISAGFQAFVLRYSCYPSAYPAALLEAAKAVAIIRENAEKWHVDPSKVVIGGFSAGGHLAGSLGVMWNRDFVSESLGLTKEEIKPTGMLLAYPVLTSGEFAHRGSIEYLLQEKYDELLEEVSLEKQVDAETVPAFLWHTFEDPNVPVENSLLMATALRQHNVRFELHIYPHGGHGLGLASEETKDRNGFGVEPACQNWIELAKTWVKSL